jgi:hypothetical protein
MDKPVKKSHKSRALCMAVLLIFAVDGKADDILDEMDSFFEQLLAFSITTVYFGTSSQELQLRMGEKQAVQFAQANWSNLTADMATGQGEYLTTLADLLKVPSQQKSQFYALSQAKFRQLLPSANTTATQFLLNLKTAMADL